MAPVIAIRIGQVRVGLVQRDPLVARKLGIKAHRLGVLLLLAANLLISR
jgi:1,4-dihydroxy-2-naphthoate octaprenyltransferase